MLFEYLTFPYHQITAHNTDSTYTTEVLLLCTWLGHHVRSAGTSLQQVKRDCLHQVKPAQGKSYNISPYLSIWEYKWDCMACPNLCTASNTHMYGFHSSLQWVSFRDTTYISCTWGQCSYTWLHWELVCTQKSHSKQVMSFHIWAFGNKKMEFMVYCPPLPTLFTVATNTHMYGFNSSLCEL